MKRLERSEKMIKTPKKALTLLETLAVLIIAGIVYSLGNLLFAEDEMTKTKKAVGEDIVEIVGVRVLDPYKGFVSITDYFENITAVNIDEQYPLINNLKYQLVDNSTSETEKNDYTKSYFSWLGPYGTTGVGCKAFFIPNTDVTRFGILVDCSDIADAEMRSDLETMSINTISLNLYPIIKDFKPDATSYTNLTNGTDSDGIFYFELGK